MERANRVGGSAPSYKHCLSMIGQYLNQQRARAVTVAEVDIGFMVFFYPDGNYQKQRTLMVSFADLLELAGDFAQAAHGRKGGLLRNGSQRDKKHPLLPQGYDTVFRALGFKLDQRQATCVTICDTPDALYLDYWVNNATFVVRDQRRQAVSHHQQEVHDAASLRRLQESVRSSWEQESGRHMGALRLNPHDHMSGMLVAFLLEDEGDYAGAEDVLKRIAGQVPDHAEAQYHYARLAYIRGDKRTALQSIKKAVMFRPEIAAMQDLYGRVLLQHGKLADAVAAFEAATRQDPANPLHHHHLSLAYQAQGRKEDAAAEQALVSLPHAAPAWEEVEELFFEGQLGASITAPSVPTPVQPPAASGAAAAVSAAPASPPPADPLQQEQQPAGETFDSQWAPADDDREFAAGLHAFEDQLPAETPSLTTSFDSVGALPWDQPSSQLPTLGGVASLPSTPDTAWLQTPTAATLSERLRQANPEGTGPLAARVPHVAEPQATPSFTEPDPFDDPFLAVPSFEVAPLPAAAATAAYLSELPSKDPRPAAGEEPVPDAGAVEIAAEVLAIQRALEAEPNRADLHRKLGFLLARQGRAAEAATEFRRALQCSRLSL